MKLQNNQNWRKIDWVEISNSIAGKSPQECRYRFATKIKTKKTSSVKNTQIHTNWSLEEDLRLKILVENHFGTKNWVKVSSAFNKYIEKTSS